MKLINYSKVRRSAATDLKKYERLGIKLFTAALKLQAKPNPSPLPMQEAYIKFYQTVFVESATKEFNRIRQDNREKAYVPDGFFLNTWREWIKDWVTANLGTLITGVNENTLAQIQQILGEGIEQGLNPFQLEKLLLEQIPNIARARAIARTESTRAYNEGKKRSATDWANQTGTTLWKLWIHGGSREPRFQHIQAQNKRWFRTIYANWIQETSKECKKELQKYKVTNLINGQRSRQFGMAGHVIRKKDGRWSNALLKWYEGKTPGHNITTLQWEHDIETWLKHKFLDDHRI